MWTRFYSKITSWDFYKSLIKYLNFLLGRVEKITPLEVYAVVLVVASVVFATRYFQQQSSSRLIKIEVTTREWKNSEGQYDYKVPYWLSDKLEVGQTQRSSTGRIKAEIIEVENYERGNDQAQIYLVIRLMADYNDKTQAYSFQGRPLLTGASIEFEFDGNLVPGQIIDDNYPQTGYEQGEFIIDIKLKYLEPWYLTGLKSGEAMKNRATGGVIAELLEFTSYPSRSQEITNLNGKLLVNTDNYQDLIAKFKIKAQKQDGNWFFAGHQRVRLGGSLWIYLDGDLILPNAEITHLEYVTQQKAID